MMDYPFYAMTQEQAEEIITIVKIQDSRKPDPSNRIGSRFNYFITVTLIDTVFPL